MSTTERLIDNAHDDAQRSDEGDLPLPPSGRVAIGAGHGGQAPTGGLPT